MYNEVLAHFSPGTYALPNVEKGELSEFEKFWVSRECILRYVLLPTVGCATNILLVLATFGPRSGR